MPSEVSGYWFKGEPPVLLHSSGEFLASRVISSAFVLMLIMPPLIKCHSVHKGTPIAAQGTEGKNLKHWFSVVHTVGTRALDFTYKSFYEKLIERFAHSILFKGVGLRFKAPTKSKLTFCGFSCEYVRLKKTYAFEIGSTPNTDQQFCWHHTALRLLVGFSVQSNARWDPKCPTRDVEWEKSDPRVRVVKTLSSAVQTRTFYSV